jgi:hypothetical protein
MLPIRTASHRRPDAQIVKIVKDSKSRRTHIQAGRQREMVFCLTWLAGQNVNDDICGIDVLASVRAIRRLPAIAEHDGESADCYPRRRGRPDPSTAYSLFQPSRLIFEPVGIRQSAGNVIGWGNAGRKLKRRLTVLSSALYLIYKSPLHCEEARWAWVC